MKQLFTALTVLIVFACCKKSDDAQQNQTSPLSQLIVNFLNKQRGDLKNAKGKQIDALFKNLDLNEAKIIKTDNTELIICDVKSYQNSKRESYTNTFYKASFLLNNGTVTHGYLYTIHTSVSKNVVSGNFADILTYRCPAGANITEDITAESEEVDSGGDSAYLAPGAGYAPIKYTHKARKYYQSTTGWVEQVEIQNTFAMPIVSGFVDPYGISGKSFNPSYYFQTNTRRISGQKVVE